MSNKKALLGGILGLAIGLAIPGGGFVFAVRGFAIGFSIGQLMFPPEIEDDGDKEEFNVTGPTPTAPVPVIWGRRITSGSIIYFGFNEWEKKKYADDRYYWAPMQIAICMSSLGFVRVKIRDGDYSHWKLRTYFETKPTEKDGFHPAGKAQLDGQTIIDGGGDSEDVIHTHSKPFLSAGGDPIDTQEAFKVVGLGGGYYERQFVEDYGGYQDVFIEGKTFPDWPTKDKIPPLKNVVTLSHPRWYMGQGTTAPNMKFEVYSGIDLAASAWAWTVTYPELIFNNSYDGFKGLSPAQAYWDVFTNRLSFMGFPEAILDQASFLYAEALFEAEGYRINALINTARTAHSLLEMLNFHVNCVLRSNPAGLIELLPLRRLDDVSNPRIDFDDEVFDAPIPGRPTIYTVRDNDIKDIDVSTDSWDSVTNEFQGRFPNKSKKYDDDGHTRKNEAGKAMTGRWVRRSYNFPMFVSRQLVNRRLLEIMRFGSRPKSIATITLDHRYNSLRKHDGLLLFSDEFDFNGLYFRVSEVEYGDLGDSRIMVKCVLDTEALSEGQDDVSEDDDDEGPVETALSALDVGGHAEYWPSNVAFKDAISAAPLPERSPATAIFGTQLYAARKSEYATESCLQSALGILTATANDGTDDALLLPATSPCTQPMANWAFRFTLVQDVFRDDHRYAISVVNGGAPIRIRLSSFEGHDLDTETDLDDKIDAADLESNSWVAVMTGTPVDQLVDPTLNAPSIVEVWRFRTLIKIDTGTDEEGTLYELQEVLRGGNKEHPQGWASGQELWISEIFREGNLPTIPDGVEGKIGGVTDNFSFILSEYDTWISLYNHPTNLRSGHGGSGDNTAITGSTGLAVTGHIVKDGGQTFVEGTDYEVDDETGLFYIYEAGGISVGNLTITLILTLSSRWAHRHLSAPAGQATAVLGTKRVRMYTQGRRKIGGIVIDAEGPLEGIRRDFQRADSNFFSGDARRRAAISPFTGAVVFKGDEKTRYQLHDKGYNADRCCIITDDGHLLDEDLIDWPASFLSAYDWKQVGAPISDFSIGFSGEFDQEGRVFAHDTIKGGTALETVRGFLVRIEDHAYPGGNKIVPMVKFKTSTGTHSLYPVDGGGTDPAGSILAFGIQTKNIVITFETVSGRGYCNFYINGVWIGDATGPASQTFLTTAGRFDISKSQNQPGTLGHYWDFWMCNHALKKDTDQVSLEDYEAPPDCLFFLPLREPSGTNRMADLSGLKNDFIKVGTLTANVLDTGAADFDIDSYYIQFPPHSDDGGFGDAWLLAATKPTDWKQLENSSGIDGTDELSHHTYAEATPYPEHQNTWYRLDVYVRWTGLESNPDPDLQGEAFLLRSGRRYGLKDPTLYDSMLEVEIDADRSIEDSDAWPTLVYTASMLDVDKERYNAITTATNADWREADLIFVMYKCKAEVTPKGVGTKVIKPWNVSTIVPIFGRKQLNYFGLSNQRVDSSQVND